MYKHVKADKKNNKSSRPNQLRQEIIVCDDGDRPGETSKISLRKKSGLTIISQILICYVYI